jgi:hypothetical protein
MDFSPVDNVLLSPVISYQWYAANGGTKCRYEGVKSIDSHGPVLKLFGDGHTILAIIRLGDGERLERLTNGYSR